MADINYDTVFLTKRNRGNYTLPTILPDAKYGKPGAETRRGHTIAAQSCATGARNRRWRKASLPRIPVTARSHIAGIERGGGRTRSFQLPADGSCVADGLFPCLYVASLMKGGCQNKNQLLFCHSERSEESQEHKLMHTRYFALLRMTLLFDNQILF